MDKYESFAIGHYLCDWPEDWSYKQIIDELKSGDEGYLFTIHYDYEGIPSEDLAAVIEDMTEYSRLHFKD